VKLSKIIELKCQSDAIKKALLSQGQKIKKNIKEASKRHEP
jgi:hypothetical protein